MRTATERPLRVIVVGAGQMGALHARAVDEHREAELAAVVDLRVESARRLGTELGAPWFTDLADALASVQANAAIIATPDSAHVQPASLVASAGLSMLVEKPLANSLPDAVKIRDLENEKGVRILPGHLLRFDQRYVEAARVISSGALGRPVMVVAAAWSRKSRGAMVADTTSPLWHFGIHHIDAIQWVCGQKITEVAGAVRVESADVSAFTANGFLDGGTGFQLGTGWTIPAAATPRSRTSLEVHCEGGVLTIDWALEGVTVSDEQQSRRSEDRLWPVVNGRISGNLRDEIDNFVTGLIDRTPFAVTADMALDAVAAATLLESAADSRRLLDA